MVYSFPSIFSPFDEKDAVNSRLLSQRKVKKTEAVNAERKPFIVRPLLFFCSLMLVLSCGPDEPSSKKGTGSSEKGMLEEKDPRADLQGRIETLRGKFDELKTPPEHLNGPSEERWKEKLRQADSILVRLEKKIKKLGEEDKQERTRIDRILQRLGVQARSMQKALQKEKQETNPHS